MREFLQMAAVACLVLCCVAFVMSMPITSATCLSLALGCRCLEMLSRRKRVTIALPAMVLLVFSGAAFAAPPTCPNGTCTKPGVAHFAAMPSAATFATMAAEELPAAKPTAKPCPCGPACHCVRKHAHCGPVRRLVGRFRCR